MAAIQKDDRRKHSRVGFATEIKVFPKTDGEDIVLEGSSRDLSMKGIFVRTDRRFKIGTACEIHIFLTGGIEEIRLLIQGTIVRDTDTGSGIEFESMDVDTYTHLKNIVLYNSAGDAP